MNHIENIEINNFKSIRHAKIEDCRRVNVFIGYPNVGKSNILEAMSLMSYCNKTNNFLLKSVCRYKDFIDIFYDGNRQQNAEVIFNGYKCGLSFIDVNKLDFGFFKKAELSVGLDLKSDYLIRNIWFHKEGGMHDVPIEIGRDFQKESELSDFNVKKYQFNNSHNSEFHNPTVLGFPFGSNLAEVIRPNRKLRKECGELFSTYNLKLIFSEEEKIMVQKQLDEFTAFQFPLSQVSDTLQRLIFHRAATATNENATLLFEEPEAHMFPPYISKFTSDVIDDENKNQFFID